MVEGELTKRKDISVCQPYFTSCSVCCSTSGSDSGLLSSSGGVWVNIACVACCSGGAHSLQNSLRCLVQQTMLLVSWFSFAHDASAIILQVLLSINIAHIGNSEPVSNENRLTMPWASDWRHRDSEWLLFRAAGTAALLMRYFSWLCRNQVRVRRSSQPTNSSLSYLNHNINLSI